MEALGFTRFGREILLPTNLSDLDFAQTLSEIEKQLGKLRSFGDWGSYRIADFTVLSLGSGKGLLPSLAPDEQVRNWTPAQYLDELLGCWAGIGIGSRERYVELLQGGMRDLFHLVYLRKNTSASLKDIGLQFARELLLTDEVSVLTDDLMHNQTRLIKDAAPIIHRALQRMGLDTDLGDMEKSVMNLAATFLYALLTRPHLFFTLLSMDNLKAFSSAHYPELCLAYMRSMDPYYTSDPADVPLDGKYYLLTAPSGTDISVLQGSREIAVIRDDLPLETAYSVPNGFWAGTIEIVLPAHESYEVIVSSDKGIVLTLMDPGMLRSSEENLSFTLTAEGYRFDIRPAE